MNKGIKRRQQNSSASLTPGAVCPQCYYYGLMVDSYLIQRQLMRNTRDFLFPLLLRRVRGVQAAALCKHNLVLYAVFCVEHELCYIPMLLFF